MNKRKHYGRKIKKTKNLYRKRKTAGQKVFGTVATVLGVSAIAFFGFCIGKPVLDYLSSIGTRERPDWSPQAQYSQEQESGSGDDGNTGIIALTEPEESTAPQEFHTTGNVQRIWSSSSDSLIETAGAPAAVTGGGQAAQTTAVPSRNVPVPAQTVGPAADTTVPQIAVIPAADPESFRASEIPAGALANRASLASALAKAKSGGFSAAVVQLKDRSGYLRYKSSIKGTDSITNGSLTLEEIMAAFGENGIMPIAEIAVLADDAGCTQFPDLNYKIVGTDTSWLDYSTSAHLRWANPENPATREYFAEVTAELVGAGFQKIMLTDVMFPNFQNYDREFIAAKYFGFDRYQYLYNVVRAGNMIEMRAGDVVSDDFGRTAEILNDTSKLHDNIVALVISRDDFPVNSGYPADAGSLTETVLTVASQKIGTLPIVPVIDSSGFDDAERGKIVSTLEKLGWSSYIIR